MNVVVDASVALKWFFRSRPGEADVEAALTLLRGVADGRLQLIQPPHFIAEMGAVLAREAAATAKASLANLLEVEMTISADDSVYDKALALAIRLRQHVFATLYHALALESRDAVLVTADERYYRQAQGAGRIVRLADFKLDSLPA